VLLYKNKNDRVMYEMIDGCLSWGILINIKDLNFMILYFKVYNLSFYLICCLFYFKYALIVCDTWSEDLWVIKIFP